MLFDVVVTAVIGKSSAIYTSKIRKSTLIFQNYNEPALATIAIVPDDGPMWPKHVLK
jgi:hypothetical protein